MWTLTDAEVSKPQGCISGYGCTLRKGQLCLGARGAAAPVYYPTVLLLNCLQAVINMHKPATLVLYQSYNSPMTRSMSQSAFNKNSWQPCKLT
jgi:hypothetical protein